MKYSWIVREGINLQSSDSNQGRNLNNMESRRMQITIKPTRKPKRFRSAFSTEQISFLEQQFRKFPYISTEHRTEIATALNMEERAIKIWFQNRRMKEKKELINKELDNETTTKVYYDPDRLINTCALPSTNEQLPYSSPIIVKPAVDTHTILYKTNTDSVHRGTQDKLKATTQEVPQNLSTNHFKSHLIPNRVPNIKSQVPATSLPKYVDLTQIDTIRKGQVRNKFSPIHKKSGELSTSKKLKKAVNHTFNQDQKAKVKSKLELGHPTTTANLSTAPENLSSNKKSRSLQGLLKSSKQAKLSGPAYYPVMPSLYAHPYISSGGMIWKPLNIIPVMSAGAAVSSNQQHFGHDQKNNCCCNCHENGQPFTVPPNPTIPYTQYVVTAPFQNPSPKF